MTDKATGGPAFPGPATRTYQFDHDGMSLRDWLAGQALAGLCANMGERRFIEMSTQNMASLALMYADAMIEELAK
jgi:hypothetical protein